MSRSSATASKVRCGRLTLLANSGPPDVFTIYQTNRREHANMTFLKSNPNPFKTGEGDPEAGYESHHLQRSEQKVQQLWRGGVGDVAPQSGLDGGM